MAQIIQSNITKNASCFSGQLYTAVQQNNSGKVLSLLEKAAGLFWGNPETGDTALHWAIYFKHAEMVKLLLEKGANPKLINKDGECALSMAFLRREWEIAKTILDYQLHEQGSNYDE